MIGRVFGAAVADLYIKYAAQHQQADGSAVHVPAFLQHEANLALQKFAEKGGTSTVVIPALMQTAPLINIGSAK